jgi:hypothetical protein
MIDFDEFRRTRRAKMNLLVQTRKRILKRKVVRKKTRKKSEGKGRRRLIDLGIPQIRGIL